MKLIARCLQFELLKIIQVKTLEVQLSTILIIISHARLSDIHVIFFSIISAIHEY